jgi:Fe-S-cluster-containing hydrogenase component 2
MSKESKKQNVNIFDLLSKETPKTNELGNKKQKNRRAEFLEPMGVKDLFKVGSIKINIKTCRGIECNLCVKACPTNALYWKVGEIGIIDDLCIHCTACVAICIVDDCIMVTRKRSDKKTEKFSNPKQVLKLQSKINTQKRKDRVESLYPTIREYLDRHQD